MEDVFDKKINNAKLTLDSFLKIKKEIFTCSTLIQQTIKKGGRVIFVSIGVISKIIDSITYDLWLNYGIEDNRIISINDNRDEQEKYPSKLYDSGIISLFEIDNLKLTDKDLIIGVTASGKTNFILKTLKSIQELKCKKVLICGKEIDDIKVDLFIKLTKDENFSYGVLIVFFDIIVVKAMELDKRIIEGYYPFSRMNSEKEKKRIVETIIYFTGVTIEEATKYLIKCNMETEVAIISILYKINYEESKKLILNNEYDELIKRIKV